MAAENRFRMLRYSHPDQARSLTRLAQGDVDERWAHYQRLAAPLAPPANPGPSPAPPP
jgi:pyruvate-ferredoxin/flavodoxin oxidoreductase